MRLYDGLGVLEAAERLGLEGREVYHLIFNGELDGGPGRDGRVHVPEAAIIAYQRQVTATSEAKTAVSDKRRSRS